MLRVGDVKTHEGGRYCPLIGWNELTTRDYLHLLSYNDSLTRRYHRRSQIGSANVIRSWMFNVAVNNVQESANEL